MSRLSLSESSTRFRRIACVLAVVFLAACQTHSRKAPDHAKNEAIDNNANQVWLSDKNYFLDSSLNTPLGTFKQAHWQYGAKVAVNIDGESQQANLTWHYADQANAVRLFGPLGSGAIKLVFDQHSVEITNNKGQSYHGKSAQGLLADIVGWPLPIESLRYWLFAQPEPTAVYYYQLNTVGQLSALRQRGWIVRYKDWRNFRGQLLPRKVFAEQISALGDLAISVKLLTKSWRFGKESNE